MSLWTSTNAAAATGGRATAEWVAEGISIDTRSIRPGDLFVALKDARDGHDFVAQALEKGAAAALVSRIPEGVAEGAPLLVVDDVLPALEALGRAARARAKARVLAITGSVGKTSTKDMAAAALSPQGRVHAAEASLNNHWGVPLTLARMPADTDWAILELGMNHPGEIAPLSRIARPHVAMITTVAGPTVTRGSWYGVDFTPRVTISRTCTPSRMSLAARVSRTAAISSPRDIAMSIISAVAPSKSRSRCWSMNAGWPSWTRRPSHTPSPTRKPLSKTEILASWRGKNSPLMYTWTVSLRGSGREAWVPRITSLPDYVY